MFQTGDIRSGAVHPEVQEPRGGGGAGQQEQLRPRRRRFHQRHRESNVPIARAQGGHGVVSAPLMIKLAMVKSQLLHNFKQLNGSR